MKHLIYIFLFCFVATGCSEVRTGPQNGDGIQTVELTPEIARKALVEMVIKLDPEKRDFYQIEKWRQEPLEKPLDGKMSIGPFFVDLKKKTYSRASGNPEQHFIMVEGGDFMFADNKWSATPIRLLSIS